MTKHRVALLGSAMMGAVLLCGVGIANAQDYGPYEGSRYYDDDYRPAALPEERVIVRPYYPVQKRQLVGRINGEINPTEFSLSREVAFSDLDLSRPLDRAELRVHILADGEHAERRAICAPNWMPGFRTCAVTRARTGNASARPPSTPCATCFTVAAEDGRPGTAAMTKRAGSLRPFSFSWKSAQRAIGA